MQLAPPHARLTIIGIGIVSAISIAVSACTVRARGGWSARGPPLSIDIALERARQALCADGGVESPRALVAALGPDTSCSAVEVGARVRCYLALPDSTVVVRRMRDGYRIWFAMPRLSDHVHAVTVRRSGDRIAIAVDSRN